MNALPALHSQLDVAWLWTLIGVCVIGVVWFVGGIIVVDLDRKDSYGDASILFGRGWDFLVWIVGGLVGLGILAFVFFPFKSEYWHYSPVKGTVTAVNSRFVSNDSGNGSSQKFVVQLAGGGSYGCLDTRCSEVKPGNKIELMCEPQFEWNGTPGYDCNWGALAQYDSKAKVWRKVA